MTSPLSFPRLLTMSFLFAASCAPEESSIGQSITCQTDPDTGVILSCEPGGEGEPGTCTDIDDDGDGEPHDEGMILRTPSTGDEDGDGISDEQDCDEQPGEDDCDDDNDDGGVDLPYDVKPQLGATSTPIFDAFAEKGAQPAAVVSVTLDDGSWRLSELQSGTPFIVTPDDCSHRGNRDVGRDRVVVTWRNADGSMQSDHLDIRYCEQ